MKTEEILSIEPKILNQEQREFYFENGYLLIESIVDEKWLKTLKNTTESIKRLPELPEIMNKANQALTYLASGQIPQSSKSYLALNEKKSEMITLRNQTAIGLLLLVILGLLVF